MDIVIQKLELRTSLSAEEKAGLRAAFSARRDYDAGQDIMVEGQPPQFIGALLEGLICRQKLIARGERQILSFPLPGDVFDLHSFLVERMDHSVHAVTRCRIACATQAGIEALAAAHPRLGVMLWRDAVVESSMFREWIVNTGRRDAYARIAHLFCEIYVRMASVGLNKDMACPLPLTQPQLSDVAGLSTIHVNRVMGRLRREGLATLRGGVLTILDWAGLVAAGEFDPGYLHIDGAVRPQGFARGVWDGLIGPPSPARAAG